MFEIRIFIYLPILLLPSSIKYRQYIFLPFTTEICKWCVAFWTLLVLIRVLTEWVTNCYEFWNAFLEKNRKRKEGIIKLPKGRRAKCESPAFLEAGMWLKPGHLQTRGGLVRELVRCFDWGREKNGCFSGTSLP